MRIISIVIFIAIVFDYSYETEEGQTGFKHFVISVPDQKMSCPKLCSNNKYGTVVVQTAVSNSANINIKITNFTAIVNYRCKAIVTKGDLSQSQHNLYDKLCDDRLEYCRENKTGFESSWQSINPMERQVMKVDLRLPNDAEELQIRTTNCAEGFVVFLFKIDNKEINYNANPAYKYNFNVFSTSVLNKSSLQLEIQKFPGGNTTDVIFNIEKSKCAYGFHEALENTKNFKCFLNIGDRRIEGGYLSSSCRINDTVTESARRDNDVCDNLMNGLVKVCRGRCYNMPDCSYLCAVGTEDDLQEGGYIMNVTNVTYPDVIGSGRWTQNGLPAELVLFDECIYEAGVCQLGNKYCKDEDISFTCTNGTYNLKNCLDNKFRSPYWRCPADEMAISMVLRTPGLLKRQNDSIFYKNEIITKYRNSTSSLKNIELFYGIMKNFSSSKRNDSFNLPVKEKRSFASFLLKNFVDNFCDYTRKNPDDVYTDDSFYYSTVYINSDNEEIDIKMSPEQTDNSTQFIKLELHRPETRSYQKIRANYFQFKNMDIMDETEAVKNNLENMKSIKDTKISQDDYEDEDNVEEEVLYKNSKMFTLKVDDNSIVKAVKYKLNMIEEIHSYSWRYKVENMCGFLDETKNWTWSTTGCTLMKKGTEMYCQCNHLSNFAMLFAMKEVNKNHLRIFEILSVIGGVINAVSMFLFLIFVLFINSREKLRIDQLNIAICLMLATIVFLLGSVASKNTVLCAGVAMVSQFLLLAAFVWKLILGINVVRLIASLRYQNEDWLVKYRWLMLLAGYIVPLVIVAISGGLYWRDYGLISDNVCWIDASSKGFLSFLIPVSIIVAVNTLGLFFIANTLIRNYINTHKTRMNDSNELIVFVQLLVSMGLTWLPAYFAIAYLPAMYVFVLFYPLQGLLMFLLVVVINKENREKVSSFIINNYNSITSKSTSVNDGQANFRSKSSGRSKGTESDNLLTGTDRSHDDRGKSEDRLAVVTDSAAPRGDYVTKC